MNATAPPPRATYLADVFDEHLDELAFLWGRWRGALRDARYTLADVAALEERVRARLEGARVPGADAWPRLAELLHGPDAELAFSAAYVLLRSGDPARAEHVAAAFAAAEDARFHAMAPALAHGPLPRPALARVRALLSARPAWRSATAAEVLAFHGALDLAPEQLRYFLEDEDAAVRRAGWRLAALAGVEPAPRSFSRALRDEAPGVARAALEAGAWCRLPGVLAALRQLADAPAPGRLDVLHLLAVLGTAEDAPRIRVLAEARELGPRRFGLVGAFGDPGMMDVVLPGMESGDPAVAAAAGDAFARLTGVRTASGARAVLPPADGHAPDAFEAEFLDEVSLPDPAAARAEWEAMRRRLAHVPRLCRGVDVSRPGAALDANLDMESRCDLLLRHRFHHGGETSARMLQLFPQA